MDNNPYKLGLDIHGVISKAPKLFIGIANVVVGEGGEVHIISGSPELKGIAQLFELSDGEKFWTHYFSVQEYMTKESFDRMHDINGYPHFRVNDWNEQKAIYCSSHSIDLHIDDQQEYLDEFVTPYMLYNHDPYNERKQYVPFFKESSQE